MTASRAITALHHQHNMRFQFTPQSSSNLENVRVACLGLLGSHISAQIAANTKRTKVEDFLARLTHTSSFDLNTIQKYVNKTKSPAPILYSITSSLRIPHVPQPQNRTLVPLPGHTSFAAR
jgi:hypothetical protein